MIMIDSGRDKKLLLSYVLSHLGLVFSVGLAIHL